MSNIKIVTDGFGRPKPVKEENLYEYGLGVDGEPLGGGESGPYHAAILLAADTVQAISQVPPSESDVNLEYTLKSSAYAHDSTASRIQIWGAAFNENDLYFNSGGINITSGLVWDEGFFNIIAHGAFITVDSASRNYGDGSGGSISITAGNGDAFGGNVSISPGTGQTNGGVFINNLPTSDPHQVNRLWIDPSAGYAIKVSQG